MVALPFLHPSLLLSSFLLNFCFLFRLKSLQVQEDSRHRNLEHRSLEHRGAEPRGSEPRTSEQRRLDQRGIDKQGVEQRTEVISDYEKQLRTLKDEIAVLSAEKSVLQGRSDKFSQIFSFTFLLVVGKAWLGKKK